MKRPAFSGPGSGVQKYDTLTALAVSALSEAQVQQTSILRLIALLTARYNWKRDELSVGQREMARLWSVTERTAKREVKRLTTSELLICKRAGVRGRVATYSLNHSKILEMSNPAWAKVGPDYKDRMEHQRTFQTTKVVSINDYTPKQPSERSPSTSDTSKWDTILAELHATHAPVVENWFNKLNFISADNQTLRLSASSTFVQRHVETHLLGLLVPSAERTLGRISRVEFEIM